MTINPIYIIPPGHELIEKHAAWFEKINNDREGEIGIIIPPLSLKTNDVADLINRIKVLQHYPLLIPLFDRNLALYLANDEGCQTFIAPETYFQNPQVLHWFATLGERSLMVFFMNTPMNRLLCLINGHSFADALQRHLQQPDEFPKPLQPQATEARICRACLLFYIFCLNTGFNPQPAIEALLQEFNQTVTFGRIKKEAIAHIRAGHELYVTMKKKKVSKI